MQIKDLNINTLFNLTSAAVIVFSYLWASLINNRRMDDMGKRLDDFKTMMEFQHRKLLAEIRATREVLSIRMGAFEKRLDRIEGQLKHPIVHPR